MFWFDPHNPDVEFCDIRRVDHELIWTSEDRTDKRYLTVEPDTICDVRDLPFPDETFWHIILDPPHLLKIGDEAWLRKKYGKLPEDWKPFIRQAFNECWRVLFNRCIVWTHGQTCLWCGVRDLCEKTRSVHKPKEAQDG